MRVKIQSIRDPEDLKFKLNAAVDQILSLGVASFSSANLYLGLKGENGESIVFQNEKGEEAMLLFGSPKRKTIAVKENDVVKDINKARNKKRKTSQ